MNTTAPIRQLTLYKHGVAHIVREASFEGTELAIAVKPSDLDDALKSCTVAAYHPATTVSGIDFQTPNGQGADSAGSMNIGAHTAMLDLLDELVGWQVAVHLHGKALPAYFSDRGRPFQADRGRQNGVAVGSAGEARRNWFECS